MSAFIDEHRARFGAEPICSTLGVSASAYHHRANGQRSQRAIADERLLDRVREVHLANYEAYGYRRTWKALLRAGEQVGSSTTSGTTRIAANARCAERDPTRSTASGTRAGGNGGRSANEQVRGPPMWSVGPTGRGDSGPALGANDLG